VVLIDFDTATGDFEDPLKRDATLVGTAGYVPLEQLAGQSVPASDLYAVGMTLVDLLSRRPVTDLPVEGGRVRFEDAVHVSDTLRYVLSRLLAPAVEERLQSAETVRMALRAPVPAVGLSTSLASMGESRLVTPDQMGALGWTSDRHLVWPTEASASSEYSAAFSASFVCEPPTVYPRHENRGGTWSSWRGDEGPEWLEVIFSEPLPPARAVRVFETHCPGAITRVEVVGQTGVARDIYRGEPVAAPHEARVLEITLEPPRTVARAIIHLDTSAVPGFNGIDSVALVAVEPVHAQPVDWRPKRDKGFWTMIFVLASTVLGLILWGALSTDAFRGALEEQPSVAEALPGGDGDLVAHVAGCAERVAGGLGRAGKHLLLAIWRHPVVGEAGLRGTQRVARIR